jgi:lipopolysaccharide transport system permease protein
MEKLKVDFLEVEESPKIIITKDKLVENSQSLSSNNENEEIEEWDLIIGPKTKLLDLQLKEIWNYRDLLWLFVRRDFVAQYKQTILGPIWHIIQPVFTTIMFLMVFNKIANIPTDNVAPILFYMAGITFWNYFSACLTNTSGTFTGNAGIFGKVYFPRLILPISIVMSNIVKLGIQFGLLAILMVWYHFHGFPVHISFHILIIPFLVLLMAGIGLGLGIIISSLTTKYRDFTVLISFAVQLAMYATPIAYPLSYIQDGNLKLLLSINPITPIIEAFRFALFQQGTFDISALGYSTIFMLVVLFFGSIIFNKVEKSFMDTV